MHLVVVGLNHRCAPLELRERLAFQQEQLPSACMRLRQQPGLHEAAILSTCNRVEIYAGVSELQGPMRGLEEFLSEHGGLELNSLSARLYRYSEPQSIKHLFTVASGLDSMVLGEAEILQQVKHAYDVARTSGTTGKVLNVLFQRALNAGRAVRAQTKIGNGSLSVGSVAIELTQKIFGDLRPYTVLLVGAGKIGELTLRRLVDRGVTNVRIINRSADRARMLSGLLGGTAVAFERLASQLQEVDIVISSTSSPGYLITRDQVAAVMPQRRHRSLCLVDLGVPRNIEPAVASLENVYVFDIDDLQGLSDAHRQQRQAAVEASRAILDRKVRGVLGWWEREVGWCVPSSSELVEAR